MKSQNTVLESNSGRVFEYAKRVALSAPGKFVLAAAVMFSLVRGASVSNEAQTRSRSY